MTPVAAPSVRDHMSDTQSEDWTAFFACCLAEALGLAACFAVADAADCVCWTLLHLHTL